mmetsp:Transcript_80123/g.159262  ORF Transcript_80123/g.159262 Transcript_80123/m.159262 type:complete len:405 (-) Transcript_80123:1133-2347(-)
MSIVSACATLMSLHSTTPSLSTSNSAIEPTCSGSRCASVASSPSVSLMYSENATVSLSANECVAPVAERTVFTLAVFRTLSSLASALGAPLGAAPFSRLKTARAAEAFDSAPRQALAPADATDRVWLPLCAPPLAFITSRAEWWGITPLSGLRPCGLPRGASNLGACTWSRQSASMCKVSGPMSSPPSSHALGSRQSASLRPAALHARLYVLSGSSLAKREAVTAGVLTRPTAPGLRALRTAHKTTPDLNCSRRGAEASSRVASVLASSAARRHCLIHARTCKSSALSTYAFFGAGGVASVCAGDASFVKAPARRSSSDGRFGGASRGSSCALSSPSASRMATCMTLAATFCASSSAVRSWSVGEATNAAEIELVKPLKPSAMRSVNDGRFGGSIGCRGETLLP